MHLSSLQHMQAFCDEFLAGRADQPLRILDVGSTEIGACYRPIFSGRALWEYVGADLAAGPNVDVILADPYRWRELPPASFDVVISGQVLEHVEFFWITMLEMTRVLKPGGLMCLIAPSSGPEHRYPVDCYRYYPDGMMALARFAHLLPLSVRTQWEDVGDPGSDFWHDSIGVYRKPQRGVLRSVGVALLQGAQRAVMRLALPALPG